MREPAHCSEAGRAPTEGPLQRARQGASSTRHTHGAAAAHPVVAERAAVVRALLGTDAEPVAGSLIWRLLDGDRGAVSSLGAAVTRFAQFRTAESLVGCLVDPHPKARAAVDEVPGFDLAGAAREYRSLIEEGEHSTIFALALALERHGTLEMAEDFRHSGDPSLRVSAHRWAQRSGLSDKLEASKDSADRPKWGSERQAANKARR